MEIKEFINKYRSIFMSHLCQYYPISQEEMSRFEYELYWTALCKNANIEWTDELLRKHKNKISWAALLPSNNNIEWTLERLQEFEDKIDWSYLSRNPNFRATKPIIDRYRKSFWFWSDNKHMTDELVAYLGKSVHKARSGVYPPKYELNKDDFEDIENLVKTRKLNHYVNEEFYDKYLRSYVEEVGLTEIMLSLYDYSQRYFSVNINMNDTYGFLYPYSYSPNNSLIRKEFDEILWSKVFTGDFKSELPEQLQFDIREGKGRLYDILALNSIGVKGVRLISKHLKYHLEKFHIADVKAIPALVNPATGKLHDNYYAMLFGRNSLPACYDLSNVSFTEKYTYNDGTSETNVLPPNTFTNYKEITKRRTEFRKKENVEFYGLSISEYRLTKAVDIFTMDGNLIVNEFVKDFLDKYFPNQMLFSSYWKYKIQAPQHLYDAKHNREIEYDDSGSKLNGGVSEELAFFYEKIKRLRVEDSVFEEEIMEDEFTEIQRKLNVIIPYDFKLRYQEANLTNNEFDLLPISKFFLQEECPDYPPETYKSLVFAENGIGDFLGIPLKRNSDYLLKNTVLAFWHETASCSSYDFYL